ncbi:MAG: CRTAC1 family protein [Candidatus Binatia bacterium]|nr:CRTAC1 family protein [Candidatus Binatia bacterium]
MIESSEPRFAVVTEMAGLSDVHDLSGSPRFRLIGEMAASSGSAVADYDCDGFEDVALLNTNHITLYRNAADGSFVPANDDSGLPPELPISGSGLVFFDAENDGDPDLWISGLLGQRFYRNEGCGTFVGQTEIIGIEPTTWSSMPIVADYDQDGYVDIILRNYAQPAQLLRNLGGPEHWLEIKLVGTKSNRDAVGARLTLEAGGKRQVREVHTGSSYLSASSLVQHFGLANAETIDTLEIRWPSGRITRLTDLGADQQLMLVEGRAEPAQVTSWVLETD